jgi:hypothetical protein
MKRAVLVACACLLATQVAAQTADADKKIARAMVEDFTRPDFEQAKSRQRDKDAIDAIKMLFYTRRISTTRASSRSAAKSFRTTPLPNACGNR